MTTQPPIPSTLLPCPFCGGAADVNWSEGATGKQWHVFCAPDATFRGCIRQDTTYSRESEAIFAWNARVNASTDRDVPETNFANIPENGAGAGVSCEISVVKAIEDHVYHEAQDTEFDTGFNEAKRQAVAIAKQMRPIPHASERDLYLIITDLMLTWKRGENLYETGWAIVEAIRPHLRTRKPVSGAQNKYLINVKQSCQFGHAMASITTEGDARIIEVEVFRD